MVWGGGDPIPTSLAIPTLDAKVFGYDRGAVGSRNRVMAVVATLVNSKHFGSSNYFVGILDNGVYTHWKCFLLLTAITQSKQSSAYRRSR
jgi:hypothetical protein